MTTPCPIKGAENLTSKWAPTVDLGGPDMPIRVEGHIRDVMVRGTIPDSIDGTFYRVGQDHATPAVGHSPLSGHGSVTAFRIHKGQVDFKVRYVETDRYKVEQSEKRSVFADILGKQLDSNHPSIRSVIAAAANINVVHWAGRLLAIGEVGPAYSMDPDSLETTGVDPFGNQIITPAFTAHPHVDPHVDEMISFGYDLLGLGLVSYSIDRKGVVKNEHRFEREYPGGVHDIAVTDSWIVFCQWPNTNNLDGKPGELLFKWESNRPARFIVAPRRPASPLEGSGWKPYETRTYFHPMTTEICHTAGAWEKDGKIVFEGTWPHDTIFHFISRDDGKEHASKTYVDLVQLEIDPSKSTGTYISDPVVLVDLPNEFPRIDERFMCRPYDHIFMNVYYSGTEEKALKGKQIWSGLNATAMLTKSTGKLQIYHPGPQCRCQEPVFIPRSDNAPEGDGYVIFAVDRLDVNLTNIVILDTKNFEQPAAVIELPMRLRAQVHGNWVDAKELSGRPLIEPVVAHRMTWQHKL